MGKDLGTYHLRVELDDGRGWVEMWHTGYRYARGTPPYSELGAPLIPPIWDTESELFETMVWMFTDGDFSCDCNKRSSLAQAYQQPGPDTVVCGDTMPVKRLTAIRPDASKVVLYESSHASREGSAG
jgi:hypothetical protein